MTFRNAVTATGIGLVLIVAAMPFASVAIDGPLLELGATNRVLLLNVDDAWMAAFVAGVALVLLLASLLRRPMIMVWAALPVACIVVWVLLTCSDLQFGTSFLASPIGDRFNQARSMAFGGYLNLIGLLVVVFGLVIPAVERRRRSLTAVS
jgi:hypothetical protein